MATIISVSNSEELLNALASAQGGETIVLDPGDYGILRMGLFDALNGQFASNVTITSADPAAPASFSGLRLTDASNITFDNVVFNYEYSAGDVSWTKPFGMRGSTNITITNSTFDGDVPTGVSSVDDGVGTGYGLFVGDSSDITLDGNEFHTFRTGIAFADTTGIEITNNNIHSIRSDGMNLFEVQDVLIENNYLHDFEGATGSKDHRDMIQFWTGGTDTPSTDIIIRGNLLDIGEGDWTQSIFMRNELVDQGLAGPEMFYQNILIENNTIYNGHLHGITVGETNGLVIRNNSVIQAEGRGGILEGALGVPVINVADGSTNVKIVSNITGGVLGFDGQNDWSKQNNAFIQNSDLDAPGYYGDVFLTSSMTPREGMHEFFVAPGSMIDAMGAGSTHVQLDITPDALNPVFHVTSLENGEGAIVFDASETYGSMDLVDARIEWNFGDGNAAAGAVVKHVFGAAGIYDVTVTVTLPDGTVASAETEVGIAGDAMVSFDRQSGQFVNHAYGFNEIADGSVNDLVMTAEGYGIQMGGTGFHATVDRDDIARIFGADNFEMSMTISADTPGASSGEIMRLHQSFIAQVDQNGELFFRLFTDDGYQVRVRTQGVELDDGQSHEIRIIFNGAQDSLRIWIDEALVATESVTGSLPEAKTSLTFGNGWGQDNFDGKLLDFSLSAASNDFLLYDGAMVPVSSTETSTIESDATPESDTAVNEPVEEPVVTEPTQEPVVAEPTQEPAAEEESSLPESLLNGGYQLANIFSVSNSEELLNALASAQGGETIVLDPGDYGILRMGLFDALNGQFASNVTITSADPAAPASFSGLRLTDASNITFDNVVFNYEYSAGDVSWTKPFGMRGSTNITITNSTFDGDVPTGVSSVDDGVGTGYGLFVGDSSDITLDGNEFHTFRTGIAFADTTGIEITNNNIHSIRSDGMNLFEVQDVLIENNYLHDFEGATGSKDHRDMIQFWTGGTDTPSTDIIIRGNLLDIGEGDWTQSIFMRNELVDQGLAGPEMFYQNILIENNTIYNGHLHGITVGETNGLVIRNNSVIQAEGRGGILEGALGVPVINVADGSTNVKIVSNITGGVLGFDGQNDWSKQNNAFIQNSDLDAPGYYGDVFLTSSMTPREGMHEFFVAPGSMIDAMGAGSTHVQLDITPDALNPVFHVTSLENGEGAIVFDASETYGSMDLVDARIEWNFGDGNAAAGAVVKHVFGAAGIYDVTVTVTLPDGTVASAETEVGIAGDAMVSFDRQSGQFVNHAYGFNEIADGSVNDLVMTAEGYGIQMGGTGFHATVDRDDIARIFGADNFEMSMTISADTPGASSGEIMRLHQSFIAQVDQNGELFFRLFTDDGYQVRVRTQGVELDDGQSHEIRIIFNGAQDSLRIWIDEALVATESVTGSLPEAKTSLTFGNGWGQDNFDGKLLDFSLSAASNDFLLYDGAMVPVSSTETSTIESDATPESDTAVNEPVEEPVVTEPTQEPVVAEPTQEPAAEEESSLPESLLNGGYQLDFASIATSDTIQLHDNAHLFRTQDDLALSFDGKKDFVALGRLTEFETSQKIAFSVDFISDNADGGIERLVWNHEKIGLTLEGGGVIIHVQNNDGRFHQGFQVDGLDLNDGNLHNATVMVDAETDRLQVVVNDVLVLDEQDTDFDFVGAGGYEWGWSLSNESNRWFEGEVHEFQVSDEFAFVEIPVTLDDAISA